MNVDVSQQEDNNHVTIETKMCKTRRDKVEKETQDNKMQMNE